MEHDSAAQCTKCTSGSLTGKDLMFHCTTFFSGTHLALPVLVLNLGESASLGTGTMMATLLAVDRLLN